MADIIGDYLDWLAPRASKRTHSERRIALRKADRELPYGLPQALETEISGWLRQYEGVPWSLATYHNHLRQFLTWATLRGKITYNAMADLPRPREGDREAHPCEDWELAIALTAPQFPWRRAVILGAYAGLRCMEMCAVTTDDINHGTLRIFGKGRKYRTVPIGPVLAEELDGTKPGHLLVGARGKPLDPRVLTQMQRPAWDALGLGKHITLHSFRHWFATSLIESGADIRVVQELLGHASVATTQGYTAVTSQRLSAAVAQLPRVTVEPVGSRLDGYVAA
jgi:integrase/recombinase XerD